MQAEAARARQSALARGRGAALAPLSAPSFPAGRFSDRSGK